MKGVILKNSTHVCDVHCSLSKKQNPENTRLEQHAFLVDPWGVLFDFRIF